MSDEKEMKLTNGEEAVKGTSSGETRGESSQEESRPNEHRYAFKVNINR
jgi:hypothetical protein